VTVLKTDAPAYTDIAGLSNLKRAAGNNDPAAIRTVAQQFESMFTRMMLKSMRDAVGPDPMFGSDQEQMYQGMADDQLSIQLSKGKGLGLADMLIRQLQKMGVKGADPSGTSATADTGTAPATGSKAAAAYSSTQRASPTTTLSAPSDATQTTFVRYLWPQAQEAGQLLGVDPRHLVAQAALETNWGRNFPADSAGRCSNNLFGMKVSAAWSGATATGETQEFQGGIATTTSARFKAYATPAQSLQDYVALLRNNPRYSAALNTGGDVQAFAAGLQRGGYATDPDYASKLAAVAGSVANKVNDALASSAGVNDLKLAGALPITPSTGTLQRPDG
jgi:flagellar protein FlgJ